MKKYIGLLSLLFSLFLVFSCEPSRAEDGDYLLGVNNPGGTGGGTGGGSTAAKVLSKSFSHTFNEDTNQFEDVTTIYNYANKKLVSIVTDGEAINITYNTNNKISKIEGSGLVSTFGYNSTNQVTQVSNVIGGSPFNTSTFTYNTSGKVATINDLSPLLFGIQLAREDTFTYSGSQITKSVSVYKAIASGATSTTDTVTSLFVYDTKIAPFSTLPYEFGLFTVSFGGVNAYLLTSNNVLKNTLTSTVDGTTVTNLTYEYDADGYATKSVIGDEYSTFEYIKL